MIRATIATGACLMLAGLAGCSHEKESASYAPMMPSEVRAAVDRLPEPDRTFIRQAAGAHMAAIRFGQLAEERGTTPRVKSVGRELVDSHTALNDELRDRAREDGVILPVARLTPAQEEEYARLSSLSGPQFDQAFLDAVMRTQQETLQSFNNEALNGQSPEIRQLANESLPDLNDRVRFVRQEIQRL